MRKFVAALGAVVLIATMAAAPVGAARPDPSTGISACKFNLGGVPMYWISVDWTHFKVSDIAYAASNSATGASWSGVTSAEIGHSKSPYTTTANQSYWVGATYMLAILQHQERDTTWHQVHTGVVALSSLNDCP